MLTPMSDFTKKFTNVAGDYLSKDVVDIKDYLDSSPREIRDYLVNVLILEIQAQYALKDELNNLILGQIPDRSLPNTKTQLGALTQYELQDTLQNNFRWGAI